MVRGKSSLCVLPALCFLSTRAHAIVTKPSLFVPSIKESSSFVENRSLLVRGGSSSSSPTSSKKKKSKKKKTGTSDTKASKASKKQINNAMKEKDAAEVLGDAIRDRADDLKESDPLLQSIDWSISSLGHAVGASDQRISSEGGGVEAATTSVLANYFLKSHGGVHGLQFICSGLATFCGLLALSMSKSPAGLVFMKRSMMFAMFKHVSGVLAGASMAAKAIPKIGLGNARQWMEQLVLDPVSQYVFYTALILVWLPSKGKVDVSWWWKLSIFQFLVMGPVLIREIISNIMVVSDILVLCSVSGDSTILETFLKISNSVINAVMSLIVSPKTWRSADPSGRQAILAKLVSQISLGMEVGVGALLLLDLVFGLLVSTLTSNRPSFREALTKLLCVRLYLHFLWVRRKKVLKLATDVRGGASHIPFRILDAIYEPCKAMGLEKESRNDADETSWSWADYAAIALGLEK